MKRSIVVLGASVGLLLLSVGCGKKGDALAALDKVDAACQAKDEAAAKAALDEAQKSSLFKKHFDKATDKVPNKSQVAPCGPLWRTELRTRLQNAGAFES
jgi:hypothetical protein